MKFYVTQLDGRPPVGPFDITEANKVRAHMTEPDKPAYVYGSRIAPPVVESLMIPERPDSIEYIPEECI